MIGGRNDFRRTVKIFGRRYNSPQKRRVWRVEGENKRSRRMSGKYGERPDDGKDGEGSGRQRVW